MSEQKDYQAEYYQNNREEIRLRKIAKRRALTEEELRVLSYHQVERALDKTDPDGSWVVALGFMRTGYSYGDEPHKQAAAEIVAQRFGIWRANGAPDLKKVHLWYEQVLERDKLQVRVEARSRGV